MVLGKPKIITVGSKDKLSSNHVMGTYISANNAEKCTLHHSPNCKHFTIMIIIYYKSNIPASIRIPVRHKSSVPTCRNVQRPTRSSPDNWYSSTRAQCTYKMPCHCYIPPQICAAQWFWTTGEAISSSSWTLRLASLLAAPLKHWCIEEARCTSFYMSLPVLFSINYALEVCPRFFFSSKFRSLTTAYIDPAIIRRIDRTAVVNKVDVRKGSEFLVDSTFSCKKCCELQ